jgi:exopolysaccharide production protein ExoQ
MSPAIATVIYILVILGLFWLDRDRKARTSAALWIPLIWLLLAGSRSVAQWLQVRQPMNPLSSPDQSPMEGSPIDRLVYTSLLVVGLIVLVTRSKRVGQLLRGNGPILLFFLYCAVSLLWSDYPDVAFKRWTKAVGDLVMVLVVLSDRARFAAVKRILAWTTFILIPLSVLFIKYYPELGKGYGVWDWKPFYTGVTTNKNTLGVICLFLGLGSVWRFLDAYQRQEDTSRTRQMIAHGTVLAMVLWLFWMANSVTSFSCFWLGSAVLAVTRFRGVVRRPAVVHLFVAAIVAGSVAILFLGFAPGILPIIGRNATLTDRTGIWAVVLKLSRSSMFGTGFESFWLGPRLSEIWSMYPWRPLEAHNGYIEVFLNLGWTGVLLLVVVVATGYRAVVAAWHRNAPVGSLMLTYFVVGVVYNFTEAAFFRMMAPAWILFLLAITCARELPSEDLKVQKLEHGFRPDLAQAEETLSQEVI